MKSLVTKKNYIIIILLIIFSISQSFSSEVGNTEKEKISIKKEADINDKDINEPLSKKEKEKESEKKITIESIEEKQKTFFDNYKLTKKEEITPVIIHKLSNQNSVIREDILSIIEEELDHETKNKLVKIIEKQLSYLKEREKAIEGFIKKEEEKSKEKEGYSGISADIFDAKSYLIKNLTYQGEALSTIKKLTGKANESEVENIKDKVLKMLDLTSIMVDFAEEKVESLNSKSSKANTSDKTAIEEEKSLWRFQLDSSISQLKNEISLADSLGIDASKYKIETFKLSGKISEDMLSPDMIKSFWEHFLKSTKNWVKEKALALGFNLFFAFLLIYLGRVFSRFLRKILGKVLKTERLKTSQLMKNFIISMAGKIAFLVFFLMALSQLGIDLKPMLTGLGIAGIVIGFALQDTLSNFASGIMLLIYKPFDVGDYVETGSLSGKVGSMSLVNTTIKTMDNQIIIVPNKLIWEGTIKNITHERIRRVDMIFSISYDDDIHLAEKTLADIVESCPNVLKHPEPIIKLNSLAASSIDFIVRPWVKTEHYYDVYWHIIREVKLEFDKVGLNIPYPQQDVNLRVIDSNKDINNILPKKEVS